MINDEQSLKIIGQSDTSPLQSETIQYEKSRSLSLYTRFHTHTQTFAFKFFMTSTYEDLINLPFFD